MTPGLWFSQDSACVCLHVLLHSGCGRWIAGRLVKLQSGNLEEKPFLLHLLNQCFHGLAILSGVTSSVSSAHADGSEVLIFRLIGSSIPLLVKSHQSSSWKNTPGKTLLLLGEGKGEEVFREFFELRNTLCICNWILVWKKIPCPRILHVYFVNSNYIKTRREGRE